MKRKIIAAGLFVLFAGAQILPAEDMMNASFRDQTLTYDQTPPETLFRDFEANIDVFGTDTLGPHTVAHPSTSRIRNNSVLGAGAGVSLFFCRFIGIGGDAYTENTAHAFIDNASGNAILRIPIDVIHLSPYAYAGGGYKWDPVDTSFVQAGAGLEVRIIPNLAIFADARYVWPDRIRDYWLGRAGVRIAF